MDGFFTATITQHLAEQPRVYTLEWANGNTAVQNSIHIFGSFTRRHPLAMHDYVLALTSKETWNFLPGKVIKGDQNHLHVQFCDGNM